LHEYHTPLIADDLARTSSPSCLQPGLAEWRHASHYAYQQPLQSHRPCV
jgi:hypothetical protein